MTLLTNIRDFALAQLPGSIGLKHYLSSPRQHPWQRREVLREALQKEYEAFSGYVWPVIGIIGSYAGYHMSIPVHIPPGYSSDSPFPQETHLLATLLPQVCTLIGLIGRYRYFTEPPPRDDRRPDDDFPRHPPSPTHGLRIRPYRRAHQRNSQPVNYSLEEIARRNQ